MTRTAARGRRTWWVGAAALLLAGCTGHTTATAPEPPTTPLATGSPTGSPTATPVPSVVPVAQTDGPVVAVRRASGAVELYVVQAGPRVRRLRTLVGPAGARASQVTLSGGPAPRACVVWDDGHKDELRCYDAGRTTGTVVPDPTGKGWASVSLSSSGSSLAWTAPGAKDQPDLVVATLDGARLGPVTRIPALDPGETPSEAPLQCCNLAWSGEDVLLVSYAYDDDVNGELARVPISGRRSGWTHATLLDGEDRTWPITFGGTSSTDRGRVLVAQEGFVDPDGTDVFRAVELDARTGAVLGVVADAAKGRSVTRVSGGARGVLYRTEGFNGDARTYWRAPGQVKGALLQGLPKDVLDVVAQP